MPADDKKLSDPASVRFRSIAEILLRGIHRCVAANRELNDESSGISAQGKPFLGNLGDALPALSGVRHRVLVSTDIGGTDPDDVQSMVHLLVYAPSSR